MRFCNMNMSAVNQIIFFPVKRWWWIKRKEKGFRELGMERRQEAWKYEFIEWKSFDDQGYLFHRNNLASCLREMIRMEWSGRWWMYLLLICIENGKAIACVWIEIVDVDVAIESASTFNCAFISKLLYFIFSSWYSLTCSIVRFDGNNWRVMESAWASVFLWRHCWW